jgi:hypothetical protein
MTAGWRPRWSCSARHGRAAGPGESPFRPRAAGQGFLSAATTWMPRRKAPVQHLHPVGGSAVDQTGQAGGEPVQHGRRSPRARGAGERRQVGPQEPLRPKCTQPVDHAHQPGRYALQRRAASGASPRAGDDGRHRAAPEEHDAHPDSEARRITRAPRPRRDVPNGCPSPSPRLRVPQRLAQQGLSASHSTRKASWEGAPPWPAAPSPRERSASRRGSTWAEVKS